MSAGHEPSHSVTPSRNRAALLEQSLLVFFACLCAGWLGLQLSPAPPSPAVFWPPAAVALAALIHFGWRVAPAVWLALAAVAVAQSFNPLLVPAIASAGLLGAGAAHGILKRWRLNARMTRRRDLALLILVGAGIGPLISACVNVSSQFALGTIDAARTLPMLWCQWGAEAMAVLCMTPLLLALRSASVKAGTLGSAAGAGLLALASLLSSTWAFLGPPQTVFGGGPWLFVPALLLMWTALRVASFVVSAGLALALVLQASLFTVMGLGPFSHPAMPLSVALLWGYAASLALIPLLAQTLLNEMREERERWQGALDATGIGVGEWDLRTGAQTLSAQWSRLIGHSGPTVLNDWLAKAHPVDRSRALELLTRLLRQGGDTRCSEAVRLPTENGREWRWHELSLQVLERSPQGEPLRLLATLADVNWRHVAEERQRMSASLFQHLHEGLVVTDTGFHVLDANPSYCRIVGEPREALSGAVALALSTPTLMRNGIDPLQLQQQVADIGHWTGRVRCTAVDGRALCLELTLSAIPEPLGPQRFCVVTVNDLTLQLQQQALLERQHSYDELTELPNLREFKLRLEAALQASEAEGFMLCVACLDIDLFTRVNAQAGAAVADQLLVQVAQRLQTALRSAAQWSDQLARLSGDEFGLILRCRDAAEARLAAERMLNVLRTPFPVAGQDNAVELTASLGATLYPADHSSGETLLRHAAHALYRVKRSGRNSYQFFDTEKRLRSEARVVAIGRMQEALDAGELQLYYQPKVNLLEGRVIGVEALLRWNHPERGVLAPALFLPEVEHTGLGVQIGDWVLENALKQSAQWLSAGLDLLLSVNVAARHLQAEDFGQRLQELLARHPDSVAQHLVLEVLESAALADIDATQALIRQCRNLGVRFALDDFGTGYSTLTYLKRLTVETLKIDRSFVQNMLIDSKDRALVEGVINLARHFGCQVVAEGVESAQHASSLVSMGCVLGQGNGIASAMPAAAVAGWIEQFEQAPVLAGRQPDTLPL
ncbi:EAL domain-containing protein [Roseateles sp.]|jgi:diguanylate cyclase (GGDEF)-like protein/PAS domain S-box-containing protein|uniref:bifunctional diguanylate cyclase/phosphodiesterase n=1 Tax=Roseateles sp. TaxID=1971397 RepID=UPI0037C8E63E